MTMIQFLSEWTLRSSILILAGALLVRMLRVKSPAIRLSAWIGMLGGSMAIPVLMTAMPKLPITLMRAPARRSTSVPAVMAEKPGAIVPSPAILNLISTPARPRAILARRFDWMRFATIVYALAAGALLARLFAGLILSLRMLRRSLPTGTVVEGTEIRESDRVGSPVTVGVLRPVILLPPDWRGWESAKLDAVLVHERSHVRRRDPAVQFVSAIHRAVLWASPLSWYLDRSIVRAAEEISDDDAVAATCDRVSYAEILLEFVQRGAGQGSWVGVPMARYERPAKRIRRILNSTAVPRGVTRWGVTGILALGAPLAYMAAAAHPQLAPPAVPIAPAPVPVLAEPAPAAVQAPVEAPPPKPAPSAAPVQSTTPELPRFEVASIKPSDPDPNAQHHVGLTIHPGGRVVIPYVSLKSLITTAFRLSWFQVSGGEAWVEKDNYEIEAKPSDDSLSTIKTLRYTWYGIEDEHLRQMLQALLIDRFQLKFHRQTKTGDVYLMEQSGKPLALHATDTPRGGADPNGYANIGYAAAKWSIYAYSMPQLAKFAADYVLHAPVLDRTELSGPFDYMQRQPDLEPNYGPDQTDTFLHFLSEAGLKLERSKGPVESFVIDNAARPTPN